MLWLALSGPTPADPQREWGAGARPLFPLSAVLVDCQTSPELPGGSSLERWVILRGRQRTRCNIVTVAHNKHAEETDTFSQET